MKYTFVRVEEFMASSTPDQDLIRKVDQLRAEAERRAVSSCKRGGEEWKEDYFLGQVDAYNRVHRFLTTGEWET